MAHTRTMMLRQFTGGALIGLLALSSAVLLGHVYPASAQGFFDRLFRPPTGGGFFGPPEPQRPVDSTRAPAPRKSETPPTATILVIGDSMADWLAYGLEEALTDSPEIGIVRKNRAGSGLIRYDARNEALEWPQAIRDMLAGEKPTYVVIMIGLSDRQPIRARQAGKGPATPQTEKSQATDQEQDNPDQPSTTEQQRKNAPGTYEFHTEQWEEAYVKRIDDAITALKSKNVPVFWVGLPSLRVPKASSDSNYLNELYRARAEKAGIAYVDVWDGFVDEFGRFMQQGPDYEGQNRRLRASDGIHFTKAGARKLASYLEREIARLGPAQPEQVLQPEPQQQVPGTKSGSGVMARPLAGPTVPLAVFAYAHVSQGLDGTPPSARSETPANTEMATLILGKGEAVTAPAGRADDFSWPRRGIAPFGADPVVTATTMPVPLAQLPPPLPTAEQPAKTASRQNPQLGFGPGAQPPPRAPSRPSVFNPFSFLPFFR